MSGEICRLCLCNDNLNPIFVNKEQSMRYSSILELTTGLNIELNDGLPQLICKHCTELVKSAEQLRNQSQCNELKLQELGYKRSIILTENICTYDDKCQIIENNTQIDDVTQDHVDNTELHDFKVEIELDKLSESSGESDAKAVDVESEKNKDPNTLSRKEKRQMYLKLVDGVLDPSGPVKCKICKKSVSKWACFISHAKLHMGFKFMCEYCGKSFISSTQLKRHCRSYHGMQRELACSHCNYLALDRAQLVLHERRAHTGERPFSCDLCAASYHSRRCLLQHIESHRDTASVQCEQCPARLKSRRHLARHRYSAHGLRARSKSTHHN